MIEDKVKLLAIFSQVAYDLFPSKTTDSKSKAARLTISLQNAKHIFQDFKLLHSFELCQFSKFAVSFIDKTNKEIIITCPGTDLSLPMMKNYKVLFQVVIDDLLILLFDRPSCSTLKSVRLFTTEHKQKYPDYKLCLTGHSLGGNIVERISYSEKISCHTFNSATTPFKNIEQPRYVENISHRGTQDLLNLRKNIDLVEQTIMYEGFPHGLIGFTGYDCYFSHLTEVSATHATINQTLILIIFLILSPVLLILFLIYCIYYIGFIHNPKAESVDSKRI